MTGEFPTVDRDLKLLRLPFLQQSLGEIDLRLLYTDAFRVSDILDVGG